LWTTFASQKGARAEAGAARGDGVVVGQEDAVHLEVGAVAEEALEVIVVAEAQEGSVSAVAVIAVAEDTGEVVVVSEGHDKHLRHEFAPSRSFQNRGKWTKQVGAVV